MQWKNFGLDEATWEIDDHMWSMYPSSFSNGGKSVLGIFTYLCMVDIVNMPMRYVINLQ